MTAINSDEPSANPSHIVGWVVRDDQGRRIFAEQRSLLMRFDNEPRPLIFGDTLRAGQVQTGLTDQGWMIEAASKGELAAYDEGCAQMMAALKNVLDGKDKGEGACNEPWESLRRRVVTLVKTAESAKVLCTRVLEMAKTLGVQAESTPESRATPRPQRRSKP